MKIVYLKPFERLRSFTVQKSCRCKRLQSAKQLWKIAAFSLVEMLMALLVASLLLAALAPVMTRKMNENLNISGTGGTKGDYTRLFDKDSEWVVPNGVNVIDITAIGGGGAGGGATYGYQEFTSSVSGWKVPDGVTKLRVFMIGGGGSGASGGAVLKAVKVDIPAGYYDYKDGSDEGGGFYVEQTIEKLLTKKYTEANYNYTLPVIDERCKLSGNTEWQTSSITSLPVKATGCGAGGAGSDNAGGGSGAYTTSNFTLPNVTYRVHIPGVATRGGTITSGDAGFSSGSGGTGGSPYNPCSNPPRVPGKAGTSYGGRGGIGVNTFCGYTGTVTAGGNAKGNASSYGGKNTSNVGTGGRGSVWGGGGGGGSNACNSGGGGGGGPAVVSDSTYSTLYFVASGGGGAGGRGFCSSMTGATVGGGGGGGGPYGGGGGGGSHYSACNGIGGAGGGGKGASGTNCARCVARSGGTCHCGASPCNMLSGAGGGGYPGGVSGTTSVLVHYDEFSSYATGGAVSSVFGSKYCNGGGSDENGKPGAVRLEWQKITDGLKCEYRTKSNSGGGGGAGQMWVGEINVTPGQVVNFNVGIGGAKPTNYGEDGKNGGATSIVANGVTYSVSGGRAGTYQSDDTYIDSSKGLGGGIKTISLGTGSTLNNWLNIPTTISADINDGGNGNLVLNGAGGGKGGSAYKMDGTLSKGGLGGNAQDNGKDGEGYGAGGGGGGGIIEDGNAPGLGGKGTSGYIFIEWGSTNGGGGAGGQVVEKKTVWVTPSTKIKMTIGKGGESNPILNTVNGVNGYFGQKGNNGTNTVIEIPNEATITALGGEGGNPGGSSHGIGGNGGDEAVENINNRIMENSVPGGNGNDDYGGSGGSIAEDICPLLYELKKISQGGCGGNNSSANGCYPSTGATGSKGYGIGSGGGGGSVQNSTAYSGGKGSDGAVIIKWSN